SVAPVSTARHARSVPDLVAAVMTSETLAEQQSWMARTIPDDTVRSALTALLDARCVMPLTSLAAAAGESAASALGFAETLRRLLNVDQSAVLSIVDGGTRVRLDEALLREQFDL